MPDWGIALIELVVHLHVGHDEADLRVEVIKHCQVRVVLGAADGEDPHVLDAKEIRLHVPDGRGVEEVLAPETIDNL